MRMIVFFDLPTLTRKNKKDYVQFRRFLLYDGFDMIQFSVYCRIIVGRDGEMQHYKRIKEHLPPAGSVRCMTVTEKQYSAIQFLVGKKQNKKKKLVGYNYYFFKKNEKKYSKNS